MVIIPNTYTVIIQGINVHSAHNNQTRSKYTLSVPYDGNNIRQNFCVKCNNTKLGIAIIQAKNVPSSHNNKANIDIPLPISQLNVHSVQQ